MAAQVHVDCPQKAPVPTAAPPFAGQLYLLHKTGITVPNKSFFFSKYVLYLFIKYPVSEHIATVLTTKANICSFLFLFTSRVCFHMY